MENPVNFSRTRGKLVALLLAVAAIWSGFCTSAASADEAESLMFSISNEPLDRALKLFAEQADMDVMILMDSLDGSRRYSLNGRYAPLDGLSHLLLGTGLEYVHDGGRGIAIRRQSGDGESGNGGQTSDRNEEGARDGKRRPPVNGESAAVDRASPVAGPAVIEEVLVTAQKRTENLQDVGITVTAFSGERINELGFNSTFDVASMIPNVSYTGEGSVDQFNIRGVQLSDFSDGNEPPVGVYVDEVYYGTLANHQSQLFDIERIEVLRGPQGTLFGRNTVGGLVHTITRKPTRELDGYFSAQLGRYEQRIVEGAVGGPLSERLRGRIALRYNEDDGWQQNLGTGIGRTATTDYIGVRIGLELDVTDDLQLQLNLHGTNQRSIPQMYEVSGLFVPGSAASGNPVFCNLEAVNAGQCQSISIFGPFAGTFVSGKPDPTRTFTDLQDPRFDIDAFGSWAKIDWDLGAVNLTSITAFESIDKHFDNDPDGPFSEIHGDFRINAEQWSQELRLSGDSDRLTWLAGLFYYNDRKFDWSFGAPELTDIFGTTFRTQNEMELDTESYAAFAQASYFLNDTIQLTVGTRWTREMKDLFITDSKAAPTYTNEEDIDTDNVTWRVSADWKPSDDRMLYANIATGFKSGAFNTSLVGPGDSAPSGEEEITTYEIGAKTDWLNRRLRVNAVAFYNDYTDVQAVVTQTVNSVPVIRIRNVGALDIKGVELELKALPSSTLEIDVAVGWIDGQYKADDPTLLLGDRGIPLDGAKPPHTPEWNISLLANQHFDLQDWGRAILQINGAWQDDVYLNVVNDPFLSQEAHSIWNARVIWDSPEERYRVEAFADNLTDEEAFKGGFMQGGIGLVSREWKSSRMAGLKFTVNFQ